MRTHHHSVDGETVTINVAEHPDDLGPFREFITANRRALAVDSETTGLDIFSGDFACRVVQFGNRSESWVIPVERGGPFRMYAASALRVAEQLVIHNAGFDLQVFDRHLGVPMESLWPKVTDTRIIAHLVDPRGKREGGTGHSLEDLTRHYIDADVADSVKTLMVKLARAHKTVKAKIWKLVDFDDPLYQLYAGMDTILAARLLGKLAPLVPAPSEKLVRYEHRVAEVCAVMERTGFLLDVEYTSLLSEKMIDTEVAYTWVAEKLGCKNIYSNEQLADTIEARGHKITEFTATGRRRVDGALLETLAGKGDEFSEAVIEAKRARKWRTTWVDGFLNGRDADDRCHASINALRARTARMSITGIPAQTLPANDSLIRRCFLADPGHLIASVDYQAQELRVLAALSNDPTMRKAFQTDADLHQITADASGVDRKVGKTVNFAYVYGSGAGNIASQCGIDVATARRVIAGFEKSYPGVAVYSRKLQREASQYGFVTTPFGRRLPVDQHKPYAALNYMVQSSSRDITCRGLLRLHDAGITPYLRLPIHDEVLASVPELKADWAAKMIGELMAEDFRGVWIGTDPEVGKRSWGSLYGADV